MLPRLRHHLASFSLSTRSGSQYQPLHVPSVCMWSCLFKCIPAHNFGFFMCHQLVCGLVLFNHTSQLTISASLYASTCTWSHSFKHTSRLTILASSCAISPVNPLSPFVTSKFQNVSKSSLRIHLKYASNIYIASSIRSHYDCVSEASAICCF